MLLENGKYGIITSVVTKDLETPEITYNFEVKDFHTYYVGESGICTHNTGNCALETGINKGANKTATYKSYSLTDRGIDVYVNTGEGIGKVGHNVAHAHVVGKGVNTTVALNGLPVNSSHALFD